MNVVSFHLRYEFKSQFLSQAEHFLCRFVLFIFLVFVSFVSSRHLFHKEQRSFQTPLFFFILASRLRFSFHIYRHQNLIAIKMAKSVKQKMILCFFFILKSTWVMSKRTRSKRQHIWVFPQVHMHYTVTVPYCNRTAKRVQAVCIINRLGQIAAQVVPNDCLPDSTRKEPHVLSSSWRTPRCWAGF